MCRHLRCNLFILVIFLYFNSASSNNEESLPFSELNEPTHQDDTKVPDDLSTRSSKATPAPPLIHRSSFGEETKEVFSEIPETLPVSQPVSAIHHDAETAGEMVPETDGQPIRVQKCCQLHQVLSLGQYNSECIEQDENFIIDVFWANRTHYWNYTKSNEDNVIVEARNPCTQSKYILDPEQDVNDTFHLLHNSSLYVPYSMDMFGTDEYCVDIIKTSTNLLTTAVICTSTPKAEVFHFFFGSGLIISIFSLSLLAFYSAKRSDIHDDHKKCLTFFAGTMATSFFFIVISVFVGKYLPNAVNILLAYIVYYLKLKYFVWLTVLCYDTYRCVNFCYRNATDSLENKKSFMKRYMYAAFLSPFVLVLINLFDKYNPALPNLYMEYSYSSSFLWGLLLFYVPTSITVLTDIFIMCSIVLPKEKCKDATELFKYLRSEKWRVRPAPEKITLLKNMYRRTVILCILELIFLVFDLAIFLKPSGGKQQIHFVIRDVAYCLQGFFVFCVFIRKDLIRKKWYRKQNAKKLDTTDTEMTLMSNGETAES